MPPRRRKGRRASWHDFSFFELRNSGVLPIAHRGGAGEHPANSLEAFRAAVDVGFRYLEIDLRGSLTGQLVLWHGKGPERIRPDRPIDLDRLKRQLPSTGQSKIVLFRDVLSQLPHDVRFFLDLKNRHACEALALLLAETGHVDRICVGSFSHRRTLDAARAIQRETGVYPCTALTPNGAAQLLYRSRVRVKTSAGWLAPAPSVQIPLWLANERLIETAHLGGALVSVWLVNDSVTMHRALDLGVDGVMTDYPRLLRGVLEERGQWVR